LFPASITFILDLIEIRQGKNEKKLLNLYVKLISLSLYFNLNISYLFPSLQPNNPLPTPTKVSFFAHPSSNTTVATALNHTITILDQIFPKNTCKSIYIM